MKSSLYGAGNPNVVQPFVNSTKIKRQLKFLIDTVSVISVSIKKYNSPNLDNSIFFSVLLQQHNTADLLDYLFIYRASPVPQNLCKKNAGVIFADCHLSSQYCDFAFHSNMLRK